MDSLEKLLKKPTYIQLQAILSDKRRGQEIYEDYSTSSEHISFISNLPPELQLPRNEWIKHDHWDVTPLMTSFHVKFRISLQQIIRALVSAYIGTHGTDVPRAAQNEFSLELEKHAHLEEQNIFPVLEELFPKARGMREALQTAHIELEKSETAINNMFSEIDDDKCYKGSLALRKLITAMVNYDTQLMQHLGEEEEIVVPMGLAALKMRHNGTARKKKKHRAVLFGNRPLEQEVKGRWLEGAGYLQLKLFVQDTLSRVLSTTEKRDLTDLLKRTATGH